MVTNIEVPSLINVDYPFVCRGLDKTGHISLYKLNEFHTEPQKFLADP